MRTIIPIPEDDEPDLFDLPPGPAPEQLELFTEESQQIAPPPTHGGPTPFTGG